jgi:hypothetical protein
VLLEVRRRRPIQNQRSPTPRPGPGVQLDRPGIGTWTQVRNGRSAQQAQTQHRAATQPTNPEFPPGPEPRAQSPEFQFPPPVPRLVVVALNCFSRYRSPVEPTPHHPPPRPRAPGRAEARRDVAVTGGRRSVLAAVAGPRLRRAHRAAHGGRGGAAAAAAELSAAPARGRPLGSLLGAPPPGLAPCLPRRRARRRCSASRAPRRRARHHRLLLLHPVRSLHPPQVVLLPSLSVWI